MRKLSSSQRTAVCHGEGPCAVIAGPGSGKTTVIVERIRYLIRIRGVEPSSILVMTFSRAAAREMRTRFLSGLQRDFCSTETDRSADVVFGTFHSVFFRILQESSETKLNMVPQTGKENYLRHICAVRPDFSLISGRETGSGDRIEGRSEGRSEDRIEGRSEDRSEDPRRRARLPDGMTSEKLQLLISRFKNGLPCSEPWLPALVREYDRYLYSKGWLDFDDMILRCRDLLRQRPDILEQWRSRFRWILVDEFQDISPSQYETLLMLSAPRGNLFAVGDDDQSVYGFRGADPRTMRRFLSDCGPDKTKTPPRQIFLTENYRCGSEILKAGASLIRANRDRIHKTFLSRSGEKGRFTCRAFSGREEEYSFLANELQALSPSERGRTAVIFRTHSAAAGFVNALGKNTLPVVREAYRPAGNAVSAKQSITEDLAAYYRAAAGLAAGNISRRDLLRIINCPERFLSDSFIPREPAGRTQLLAHAGYSNKAVREFLDDLDVLNGLSPLYSMKYLLDSIGYRVCAEAALRERRTRPDCSESTDVSAEKINDELLAGLLSEAAKYRDAGSWTSYLERLSQESENMPLSSEGRAPCQNAAQTGLPDRDPSLKGQEQAEQSSAPAVLREESVHILTMHACKGLEFDTVYIPNLNEGSIPSRQAFTSVQIEEERRLLYVAVTRARHSLTVTYTEGTPDRPAAPSRFLFQMCRQYTGRQ